MKYQPTIGLEVHVELKTRTKMFCGCINVSDEKQPNKNVCPICLAHPGTLPTINKKAVESVLKLGLALNSEIPETSKFDRKNYFYPDLPKGYQISQYDKPLVLGGELNGVRLRRIHLEEDTARLIHSTEDNHSLVDFNRAGVPLMELVTEPDIKSGKEAVAFARELQLILRYLDISNADMEKGQMRVEVNISVSKDGALGTKVEIKNLNSFRDIQNAIDYQIERQITILENGGVVAQETWGTAVGKQEKVRDVVFIANGAIIDVQRSKEEAHDYRYFPEPDLPVISLRATTDQHEFNTDYTNDTDDTRTDIKTRSQLKSVSSQRESVFNLERLRAEIPELPQQKRRRLAEEYGLNAEQAEALVNNPLLSKYFEESASELNAELRGTERACLPAGREKRGQETIKMLYNYLTSDLLGLMNQKSVGIAELKITPEHLAHLVSFVSDGKLSSRMAKDALAEMFERGIDPKVLIREKGLIQISDEDSLKKAIKEAITENPTAVQDYKKGKENALQFLIGKAMANLKGKANPDILRKLLSNCLSK